MEYNQSALVCFDLNGSNGKYAGFDGTMSPLSM